MITNENLQQMLTEQNKKIDELSKRIDSLQRALNKERAVMKLLNIEEA